MNNETSTGPDEAKIGLSDQPGGNPSNHGDPTEGAVQPTPPTFPFGAVRSLQADLPRLEALTPVAASEIKALLAYLDADGPAEPAAIVLLREAAALFRFYERHHRDKVDFGDHRYLSEVQESTKKAERNAAMAARIEGYLARPRKLSRPVEPLRLDEARFEAVKLALRRNVYFRAEGKRSPEAEVARIATEILSAAGLLPPEVAK